LVAGGEFTTAGGASANGIARWNGSQWRPLGAGAGGTALVGIYATIVLPGGDLVVAGRGTTPNNVFRWNGTAWYALGPGMDNTVRSLAVLHNGDIVAGGFFHTVGGVVADGIARWNGTSLSAVASPSPG